MIIATSKLTNDHSEIHLLSNKESKFPMTKTSDNDENDLAQITAGGLNESVYKKGLAGAQEHSIFLAEGFSQCDNDRYEHSK